MPLDSLPKTNVRLSVEPLSKSVCCEMEHWSAEATKSTRKFVTNCDKLWNIFNDTKAIKDPNGHGIQTLHEVEPYFDVWEVYIKHEFRTRKKQLNHIITWQTMFDLKVLRLIYQNVNTMKSMIKYFQTE